MKSAKIKELISDFLHNDMPEEIQHLFRRWLTAPTDREAKEAVLFQIWNELAATPTESDYRQKLTALHRKIAACEIDRPRRRAITLRRFAVAASLLLVLLCGEYLFLRAAYERKATICLVTAPGSKGEFTLPDGTRVWLNSNSRLVYPKTFHSGTRKVRLEGNAFFQVKPDVSQPFLVDMDVMQVEVLGTEFDAEYRHGDRYAETVLKSGSIRISASGLDKPVHLQADQRLLFDVQKREMQISAVQAEDYCSWTSRHLVFANKPLSEILVNLENWYDVRFRYEKGIDLSEKLSFHLEYEPLEETLHLLSRIAHIEYDIRNDEVYLTQRK